MGELFTIWMIRFALALYVLGAACWLRCLHRRASCSSARWLWTLGCGFYFAHVVCAFHFFHDWSHTSAYQETASVVDEIIGVSFGAGLYFNYAFTLIWMGDAAWTWIDFEGYRRRPRWVAVTIHSFLTFMVFNSTIVFETGPLRWIGLAAGAGLAVLWWSEWRTAKRASAGESSQTRTGNLGL